MTTKADIQRQTAIRRKMLANGYTPLANKEKMCLLKGWSRLEVDEELIGEWSDQFAYQTTGLRIDPPLVLVDVDIDDEDMVAELWNDCVEAFGDDWARRVLIRYGSGHKEAWLFRVDEPFHVPPGPKYVRPDEDPEDEEIDSHKVELFGGAAGRQMGAFGVHTPGKVWYDWADDESPENVPIDKLPILTKEQVFSIYATYVEILEQYGWHRIKRYNPDDLIGAPRIYDLEPDMEVVTQARGKQRVDELVDGDRVRMREVTGTGNNTSRGLVHEYDDGVGIWDAETGATHMMKGSEPATPGQLSEALGARLSALGVTLPEITQAATNRADWSIHDGCDGLGDWALMAQMVRNLQARYAHFPSGKADEEIVDIFTGVGYNKNRLATAMSRHAIELPTGEVFALGPKAGEDKTKLINPINQLLSDPDTLVIEGYQFTPGNEARLLETPEGLKLNIYEPPDFGDIAPEPASDWFMTFMEYLVPDEFERDWLLNWIAHKVQHPAERGVGVVLVTPTFGTGRNVLMKLLRSVLGDRWCGDVPAGVLMGGSSQSQYDDMLMNKTLVTCDEIAMVGSSFDKRMAAYERLKTVIDPYPQVRSLNRKGLSHVVAEVYYSAILASNHPSDALPLPPGDRRFAVLSCTRTPLKTARPDIKAIVDRVLPRGRPALPGAALGLRNWLMSIETDAEAFYTVPETEAKATLEEDSEGDVELTIRRFIEKLPEEQPCFWFEDLVRRGEEWLRDRGPVRNGFRRYARQLLRSGFAGWEFPNRAVRISVTENGYVTSSRVSKGVVHRIGTEISATERGEWLGDE